MVYFGAQAEQRNVGVPDFRGMNRQQASDAAGALGLYILVRGNPETSHTVVVTGQAIPPKTEVPVGTTITLEFTDTAPQD